MTTEKLPLIWIDLEMTGLNPDADYIIEIATIITDGALNVIAEGPSMAVFQPTNILAKMDNWNQKQHTQSGLLKRVQESTITTAIAEQSTLEFLAKYVDAGKSPMAGNSICQDRRFLFRHMPTLERFFHYRNVDVSTIKELALRWTPELVKQIKKDSKHLALDDIKDSIEELRFYRQHFFR